jgi:sulfite reductase beta subunit-like hemoprotein
MCARRSAGALPGAAETRPRDRQCGLITDIIACPGLDYCALATARSIPVAQEISERFGDPEAAGEIGPLKIKISGCINACGHHHVGHIGILGLEKRGRNSTRSRSAVLVTKTPRSARSSAAVSIPISNAAPALKRPSSNAIAGLAQARSRLRFMVARLKPPETGV